MQTPFFSIIIVSYQAAATIRNTIESVLMQSFGDYEIIVKDACSTDGTLEQLPEDPRIRVYAVKDKGIYDGMNEAVGYARGKYLHFLNCGDRFFDGDVLQTIWETAKDCPLPGIVYGDYCRCGIRNKQPATITPAYLFRCPLCHQSEFFHRDLFAQGGYDLSFRIMADHDFALRAFSSGAPFVYVPYPVCDYLGGGFSESPQRNKEKHSENAVLQKKYFTKQQRFLWNLKMTLSLRPLRVAITSDRSPLWLRRCYRVVANWVNR